MTPEATTSPEKKTSCIPGCLVVVMIGVLLVFALRGCSSCSCGGGGATDDGYISANGNIWTGVKLYYGENKAYAFEVLGGNDTVLGDAEVRVRYPDGTEEWKSRDSIAQSGIYWVRADDPALKAQAWDVYAQ